MTLFRFLAALMVLVAAPASAERVKDLGSFQGLRANQLGQPLDLVARYCMLRQFPPLTVHVVQAGDGKPGKGFTKRFTA